MGLFLETNLVKRLKKIDLNFYGRICRVFEEVESLLTHTPLGTDCFTDHGIEHSTLILERIDAILRPKTREKLNANELYVIILAALLHDLGMWIRQEEYDDCFTNPDSEFAQFCEKHNKNDFELLKDQHQKGNTWLVKAGLKEFAAFYARSRHHERLGDVFLTDHKELVTLIGDDHIEAIATVCAAHGWERDRIFSLKQDMIGGRGKQVCLPFLAVLLRIGDLLAIGSNRVSRLLWRHLTPMSNLSEAHWLKEMTMQITRCKFDEIVIKGSFDAKKDGVNAIKAFALAKEWMQWIQEEIDHGFSRFPGCVDLPLDDRNHYVFERVKFDHSGVQGEGLIAGQVMFDFDSKRMLELLGAEIYSQGCVFIRELMQNAIDATRAQVVRDNKNTKGFQADAPVTWPRKMTEQSCYDIDVTINQKDGIHMFSVKDRGIGMTVKQIERYFLKAGQSYYRSEECKNEFPFPKISRFGIGFLSCMSVARKITVKTRTHYEKAGVCLEWNDQNHHYVCTVDDNIEPGTIVTLTIDPKKIPYEGWDSLLFGYDKYCDDFGFFAMLNERKERHFEDALYQWCLWHEFTINVTVNGEKKRKNGRINDLSRNPNWLCSQVYSVKYSRRPFPIKVLSQDNQIIADGIVCTPCFEVNRIPASFSINKSFCDNILAASKGFFLYKSIFGMAAYGTGGGYSLQINWQRLPPKTFTASRSIRETSFLENIMRSLLQRAISKLFSHTFSRMLSINPLAALVWGTVCYVNRTLSGKFAIFRTKKERKIILEENLFNHANRFIIVPVKIALFGPWKYDIPCVGFFTGGPFDDWDCMISAELPLVEIPNLCTGHLYPRNANLDGVTGLSYFQGKYTYLSKGLNGFCVTIPSENEKHKVLASRTFDESRRKHLVSTSYDKKSNPWDEYGISLEAIWPHYAEMGDANTSNFAEQLRQEVLNIPPINYPEDLLTITLEEDTSGWW